MKKFTPTKQQKKKDFMLSRLPDVRPLTARETKLDTRKGMPKVKGLLTYPDLTEYSEQNLF